MYMSERVWIVRGLSSVRIMDFPVGAVVESVIHVAAVFA